MDTLYERGLAPLPKSEGKGKSLKRYHEQFQWPLAAAMLILLAETFLPERKRERKVLSSDLPQPPTQHSGAPSPGPRFTVRRRSAMIDRLCPC